MKNEHHQPIYWSVFSIENDEIHLAATSDGLCYINLPQQPFETMVRWVSRWFPKSPFIKDDQKLRAYAEEVAQFLQGTRKNFTFSFDMHGTLFQKQVWNVLQDIPYGQTQSYSEIAAAIQRPSAVRAVGAAIGANPIPIAVPCHRVIGKNGALTGFRGGLAMKSKLLQLERIMYH